MATVRRDYRFTAERRFRFKNRLQIRGDRPVRFERIVPAFLLGELLKALIENDQ